MRSSSLAVVVLLLVWPFAIPFDLFGQEATPNTYAPPLLTLERLMQDDPTFNGLNLWFLAADPVNFRATLEKQAASGKLVAQIFLGEAYIPPECTFLPFKTAPADCPEDPTNNLLGLTRSFDTAIHWLTLASEQGSGEASEVLAEVIERTIQSPTPSRYQMTDVAHYHALARSQGFDLQDVEISCYSLDPSGPAGRLIMADTQAQYQFTPQELDFLHAAGASGTLRYGGSNIPGSTTVLRHPEGPKIHARVILGHPTSHEVFAPLGDRVDVVYLQQRDQIVTIPPTFPALRRVLSIRPPTADEPAAALLQEIDGRFGGCATRTFPPQSSLPKP
jgi:hypothetical protein